MLSVYRIVANYPAKSSDGPFGAGKMPANKKLTKDEQKGRPANTAVRWRNRLECFRQHGADEVRRCVDAAFLQAAQKALTAVLVLLFWLRPDFSWL
jgi:hypothetical protein